MMCLRKYKLIINHLFIADGKAIYCSLEFNFKSVGMATLRLETNDIIFDGKGCLGLDSIVEKVEIKNLFFHIGRNILFCLQRV